MSAKRIFLTILAASGLMLAVGIGPRLTGNARALPPTQAGATIPYSGRLSDEAGKPVADGAYDFTFALYAAESGGEPLWTEEQAGVAVQGGTFTVLLGRVAPLPKEVLEGGARWLEVGVRGPAESQFTALSPRQELSAAAPAAPAGASAPANGLSCWHTHWGETWTGTGSVGLKIINTTGGGGGFALYAESSGANAAIYARKTDSPNGAIMGQCTDGAGVYGYGAGDSIGVLGRAESGKGVYGQSAGSGVGVYGKNDSGSAIGADGGGIGRNLATIRANNWNTNHGMAAYLTNNSDYHTVHLRNYGTGGGVLYLQNNGDANGTGGWDFISAQNKDETDLQFRVLTSGEVRSDVGFNTPASDLAEMLPAVEGLEPGDVLVVGMDGKLTRSSAAYQSTVVGVYSTQPGFVGGQPVEGEAPEGHIPLAVVGVVPVKASAENGPIHPGDLLVASSTPGHAMKAGPNPAVGTVIGKALQGLESGTGVIQMLVMLQ